MEPASVACAILSKQYDRSLSRAIASASHFGLPIYVGLTHDQPSKSPTPLLHFFSIPWRNDFADARNTLLRKIQEPFVLWMDSDEELFSFPHLDWTQTSELLFYVRTQFSSLFTPRVHIRMHRNLPSISWKDKIHEKLCIASDTPYSARFISSLILIHHGYEDEKTVQNKHARNLSIAEEGLDNDPTYAELLVQARAETALGRPNFLHWLVCYQEALSSSDLKTQPSYFGVEPAFYLCMGGYTKPAEQLLEKNPLNLFLQISVLAAEVAFKKRWNEKRLEFTTTCLQNGFFDVYENFPKELLGANRSKLMEYIENWILEWRTPMTRELEHDLTLSYCKTEYVDEQRFGDEVLVMSLETKQVVVLNEASALLWCLFQAPLSHKEACAILAEAHPSTPPEIIQEAVQKLFSQLLCTGLIAPAALDDVTY